MDLREYSESMGNPYEAPKADPRPGADGDRNKSDGHPIDNKTLVFIRLVGCLHLAYSLWFLWTPYVYVSTLLGVANGTYSAPWLGDGFHIINAIYAGFLSLIGLPMAYGLLRRRYWARPCEFLFLILFAALFLMNFVHEALKSPVAVWFLMPLLSLLMFSPMIWLVISPKCKTLLSPPSASTPSTRR